MAAAYIRILINGDEYRVIGGNRKFIREEFERMSEKSLLCKDMIDLIFVKRCHRTGRRKRSIYRNHEAVK